MAIADTAVKTGNLKNGVSNLGKDRAQGPLFSSPFLSEPGQDMQASSLLRQTRPRNEPGSDLSSPKPGEAGGVGPESDKLGAVPAATANRLSNKDHFTTPQLNDTLGTEAMTSDLLRQSKLGSMLGSMDAKSSAKQESTERGGEFGNFDVLGEKGFSASHMSALWQNAQGMKSGKGMVGQAKDQALSMAKTAFSTLTSNLLKAAVENLIDSWGLTLIYINFHVFCRLVFGPEYFCKLGQEWTAGGLKGGGISKAAGAEAKTASSGIMDTFMGVPLSVLGTFEAIILGIVDAIIIFFTLAGFTPIIIVLLIVIDPVGTFTTTLPFLYQLAVSAFNIVISKVGSAI